MAPAAPIQLGKAPIHEEITLFSPKERSSVAEARLVDA